MTAAPAARGTVLTIVIPALNEEKAIAGTVERCLEARDSICRESGVDHVRVIVVSDGSTDRTAEIARGCGVPVIELPQNRGYGAAIKTGWARGGGDLLAFLDADGTCDPRYFGRICHEILANGQDIVLGCRMGPDSRMPLTRRIGNAMFAAVLGFLSRKRVRDTASGMRVVRRTALRNILPLPDGMHFTPAMSARALMDDEVRIAEVEMRYSERIGDSKLRVLADGVRFLRVILAAAAYVRVSALTAPILACLVLSAVALLARPVVFYAANWRLEEWMFYRCALAGVLASIAVTILCGTIISEHLSALAMLRYGRFGARTRGLWRYQNLRRLAMISTAVWFGACLLNLDGLRELFSSGTVSLHWSRVIAGAFATIGVSQLLVAMFIIKIMRALHQRQPFLHTEGEVPEAESILSIEASLA